MRPGKPNTILGLADPNELVVDSARRRSSYVMPLAISHLLDIKVSQTNAAPERVGEEMTSRSEMVAMVIAMARREDTVGLSPEDRILRYRSMAVGEVLEDPES